MFVVLEGLDGAGKSTQLKMLEEYISSGGRKVSYIHFPRYDAPVTGDMIASFLRGDFGRLEDVHPKVVAYFFAEDRHGAAGTIREMLEKGHTVVLDRYVYSNIAFQCAKTASRSEAEALRKWIYDTEYGVFGIPRPDINLFLDVPLSFVGEKLRQSRSGDDGRDYLKGKSDIHEADLSFQEKVREIYLQQCAIDPGFIRIECGDSEGNMLEASRIFERIKKEIDPLLK